MNMSPVQPSVSRDGEPTTISSTQNVQHPQQPGSTSVRKVSQISRFSSFDHGGPDHFVFDLRAGSSTQVSSMREVHFYIGDHEECDETTPADTNIRAVRMVSFLISKLIHQFPSFIPGSRSFFETLHHPSSRCKRMRFQC